ncbi:MAG: AMP-binding protein, partial [Phaeodactylibacter sp.]|nr:AMP-binding protein [Phaeodactylibacter sp.]
IIADKEAVLDPRIMAKELEAHDITLMQGTPATWKMLIQDGWGGKSGLKALSGGEALDKKLAEGLFRRCAEVWNFYGPTETTVYSAIHQIREQDFAAGPTSLVPVGTPVRHNWLYVLNEELQPVPKGVAGEVYIGGASLAKGYLNLPGLTGERFIPNPFAPGTKMYRTGDRGFFQFSGELEFIERIDNQVKIRGFRIELAEIEQALLEHPSVAACAARAWENNAGIPALYIYAVAEQGDLPNWPELKAFLAERLPAYMVPASLSWLDELPHTPNGKVDRKSLPRPEQQQHKSTELPVNDTEATVLELFKQALELGSISVTDDFFDLGGHSLLAVALMAKIEARFEQRLPLASLFQHGSPRGIAQLLSNEAQTASGWKSLVPIKASGSRTPLYIVHGAGLNVLLFNTLSKHMHPDQPVYGLQAKGMNGIDEPLYSINEIADYYLEQVLEHQPKGPYAIAGFSFGGFVAFEMGRKLHESNKKVAFIGLFDAVAAPPNPLSPTEKLLKHLSFNVNFALHSPLSETIALSWKKMKNIRYRLTHRLMHEQDLEGGFKGLEEDVPDHLKMVKHAKFIALKNYKIAPCPISVHLFKAQKQTYFINDPKQYDWHHYALGGVNVIDVPGEHSHIFAPPNESIFAGRLQKAIDGAIPKDTILTSNALDFTKRPATIPKFAKHGTL